MDLRHYETLVKLLSRHEVDYPIFNGTADHARILMKELIARSTASVEIATGSCHWRFYEDMFGCMQERLKQASAPRIRILVWEEEPEHSFVAPDPRVEIRYAGLSQAELPHFAVSDRKAYRFETPHAAFDSEDVDFKVSAFGNFGSPDEGEALSSYFDRQWAEAPAASSRN